MKYIKVKTQTHKRLADYGNKSETFDQVINRLLDRAEQSEE